MVCARVMARERAGANASTSDGGAEESAEERQRRVRDEDALIARAKAIREKIKALEARTVKTHDDSRRKSHWEYVLTEMTWLARDFASERDWKQETSRQVSHLAAACEGAPMDREEAENGRKKVHCAKIASEVAEFWAEAWERAKERPLPNATELVDGEDEDEEHTSEGGDENKSEVDDDMEDVQNADGENPAQRRATLTPGSDPTEGSMEQLANTPPPPPGMKVINSWASNKLYLAMVEMKRDLVLDAIEIKEAKDQKEAKKTAKKTAKKQKVMKSTRGRGAKKKDEPEEDQEDDGENGDDGDAKSDRIALAEALEMDGMDMDMDLLAPPTPPLIDSFIPVIYDAVPALTERVYRETMQIEAQKFAEYERSLRGWEENERKRARALAEATRHQAEEEAYRATMEERRAFLAAAAAHGNYFDEEGYMVDIKGRRKKNRRGEFIQFGVPGHEVDMDFGVPIPKRSTMHMDERRRAREAKKKRRAGAMRSWSPMEDQLLCAIVHEFGSNWALITDAFAAGAPIKGTYHRIEHCRWRFSHLTQVAEQEQNKNAIAALNLSKSGARMLIARALPVEDETVRVHFDRSCAVMAKHMKIRKAAKIERLGMDKSRRHAPHRSWRDVQTICGQLLSPAELAEQTFGAPPVGPNGGQPGLGVPGGQRLGTISPMTPSRGAVPGMAPGSGQRAPLGGVPGSTLARSTSLQLQQLGSYSPSSGGGTSMQIGGIGSSMPTSTSNALAPGSYNLSGSKSSPVKKTTTMKRKGSKKSSSGRKQYR